MLSPAIKKMKRFNKIIIAMDTGLIASTVNTEGVSIAAFAIGFGLPVGTALKRISLPFFLGAVST